MTEHYDVIVIGSGAGGGTLTWALAPTGKRILLLERGDFLPREPENWSPTAVWTEGRYHNSGKWTNHDNGKEFSPKQNYYVGGNTKFYGAVLFRFRERDFGEIRHVDGVSPAWPISYQDLEPYYSRAEHLYHVHGQRGIDPTDPPSEAPYRYPPLSHEPRIAQLEADLAGAGLRPFPLPVGILLDEAAPRLSPCIRCATFDGYPCLVNGKADAQIVCVEPALRHPNVTLLTNALVTRLETSADGRTVTRVLVDRDGAREEYSADVVVVSCGAINSAALLLASASHAHPNGLGNGSDQVGRHLMLHNNASLIAFSETPNLTKFQKTLGVHDFYFGDGDWPYPLGAIQMNWQERRGPGQLRRPRVRRPGRAGPPRPGLLDHHRGPAPPREPRPGRPGRPDPSALHAHQRRGPGAAHRQVQEPAGRHALPQPDPGEPSLLGRSARAVGRGPPERDRAVRHRPGHLGTGPELQDARARQPLRGRLELLRLQHRGEPDPDHHRQHPAGRRPPQGTARRTGRRDRRGSRPLRGAAGRGR
jgi:hypothetical protein